MEELGGGGTWPGWMEERKGGGGMLSGWMQEREGGRGCVLIGFEHGQGVHVFWVDGQSHTNQNNALTLLAAPQIVVLCPNTIARPTVACRHSVLRHSPPRIRVGSSTILSRQPAVAPLNLRPSFKDKSWCRFSAAFLHAATAPACIGW
jgi:hypothetical protein